jgi:hypothetical protein
VPAAHTAEPAAPTVQIEIDHADRQPAVQRDVVARVDQRVDLREPPLGVGADQVLRRRLAAARRLVAAVAQQRPHLGAHLIGDRRVGWRRRRQRRRRQRLERRRQPHHERAHVEQRVRRHGDHRRAHARLPSTQR